MPAGEILVAKQSFHAYLNGKRVFLAEGATVRAGHPITVGRAYLFRPISVAHDFDTVEQATAAPGEVRELPKRPGRPKLPRDAEGNIIRED